ncbi:hypothetical protein ONS95_002076 [Cadophora gregata]|uniref:uncharacterized protein n=1 Tax=Cadophora gregata TaxID=51156 RepID=UPI0026DCBDF4|nr:uncharacterized protein ONS95_002076 [Cadophora gregata]KAK0111738.1 hypothetical protein ONS95_002076 [Cadophora gregata]
MCQRGLDKCMPMLMAEDLCSSLFSLILLASISYSPSHSLFFPFFKFLTYFSTLLPTRLTTTVLYLNPLTSRSYTYSSVRSTTLALGTLLQTHPTLSLSKGQVLALFAQNCIDIPAITWSTHYAGGVVSPANPAYTVRELVHHLHDSGAKFLFTQKSLLPVALEAAREVNLPKRNIVCIGEEKDRPEKEKEGIRWFPELLEEARRLVDEKGVKERVKVDPEKDLAVLAYSSGTTGLPKGVMLSHSNMVSNLFMLSSSEGTILHWKKDRVLSVLPYYHIYGLQCLVHLPAYAGFTTIVMSAFDLKLFCRLIQDYKITYTYVAPPVVLHLAKNPVVDDYDLSSLRMMTSGAAPLTKELIHAVHKRLGIEVKQAYGLSETSPATHIQVCHFLFSFLLSHLSPLLTPSQSTTQIDQLTHETYRNNGTTALAPSVHPSPTKPSNSCPQKATKSPPAKKAKSGSKAPTSSSATTTTPKRQNHPSLQIVSSRRVISGMRMRGEICISRIA